MDEIHANQQYDGKPYRWHLMAVAAVLLGAGLTSESDQIIADAHDAIEDAGDRRDEAIAFFKENLTAFEFNVVWALTGIGHNRKTRIADAAAKMAAFPEAANYKLADRIANWKNSIRNRTPQARMYSREDEAFTASTVSLASNPYLIARYAELRTEAKGIK